MIRKACAVTCSIIAVLTVLTCSSSGQTAPTFTRGDITVGNSPVSLAVADFNGDGKLDIAVLANTTSTAVLSIFLGDGSGNFTFKSGFSTGFASTWLTAGDLNGDGLADLVVANSFSRSVSVFLATGSGAFGARSDISLPGRIESVLLADFNGDGKLDIAAPDFESAPQYAVSILLGNGDGTFGPNTEYPTLNVPFVVVADDFNSDGKLDLAINGEFGGVSVLLGNGNGTFQPKSDSPTGSVQSSHLASGDFNGDGKHDLAVANNADDSVSILLGNGDGTFNLQPPISIPVTPFRLAVGDFNGDGLADLVVARRNSAKVSILLGKNDGTFPTTAEFDVGAGPQFVIVKDLNGDGKLDVATANYDAGTISVLLNSSTPQIGVSPTQITFPPTLLNTRSAPVTVTISNPGTAALLISDISTHDPFALINTSPNIGNILPATTATFDTIFTPLAPGPFSGSVTITSNAPTSPTLIPLQGTGVLPQSGGGSIFVIGNRTDASFTLNGPITFLGNGTVSFLLHMPPGDYKIRYGDVIGFLKPPDQTLTLAVGRTITFVGNYRRLILALFAGLNPDNPSSMQTLVSSVTDATNYPNTFIPGVVGQTFTWDALQASPNSPTTFVTSSIESPQDRVAVVGHSYGGDTARLFAKSLRKNNNIIADALITIDPIDPKVCHSSLLEGLLDCAFPSLSTNPCIQSGDYYDPPPQVRFLVDYVERYTFCPLINGYNFLGVPSIVASGDTHTTIDDDEPNVRVPTRLLLNNLTNIPKTLSLAISNVKVTSISAHNAVVSWRTNIDSSSLIEFGRNTAYDSAVSDQTLVQIHSVLLSALLPSTVYHYSVVATASSDQAATTRDATFTTTSAP